MLPMSTIAMEREHEIDVALSRGILYDILALGFRPPSQESLSRLQAREAADVLHDAAASLDGSEGSDSSRGSGSGSSSVAAAAQTLLEEAARADLPSLHASHQFLFGHTAHGKVPPYETEYGVDDPFRQSHELADLLGFYRAFGLDMNTGRHERCDHVAAECEFLAFLACKEAHELTGENSCARDEVRNAERLFLRDHAGRFGRAFALALARDADHPFYKALGELCGALLLRECEAFGVRPGAELIPLRSTAEDNVPMACGGCALAELGGKGAEAGAEED